jgi:hypothetical protein
LVLQIGTKDPSPWSAPVTHVEGTLVPVRNTTETKGDL